MRLLPRLLPCLLCAVLAAACSEEPGLGVPVLVPTSGAEGPELTLDLGQVLVGDSARRSFKLENRGESMLRLVAVQPSAQGTGLVMEATTLPLGLTAGDAANLTVVFTPEAGGPVSVDLVLALEGATLAQVVLHLSGEGVDGKCLIEPAAVDYGTVPTLIPQSRVVRISNGSALDWTVLVGELEGDSAFTLGSDPGAKKVPAGQSVAVTIHFYPLEPGIFSGHLPLSGKARCLAQKVALAGAAVEQTLTVTPASLEFGGVAVNGSGTRTVTVRNLSSTELTLSGLAVTSQGAGFALATPATGPVLVPKGGLVEIGVVFSPLKAGEDTGELTAATTDPKTESLKVALKGTGI